MADSTSTVAGTTSGPPAAASYYQWHAPGKTTSIRINLDTLERLEREVVDTFRAVTKRGSEIGGLLLGRPAVSGGPVLIEDFELIPCGYNRGPLYLLAEDDKRLFSQAVTKWKLHPERGLVIVGFFRSNTRKDLALDDDDIAIIKEHFTEPRSAFLLVKPFAMKPGTGGFFLWEDGQVQRSTHLQFPFKKLELLKPEFAASIITSAPPAPPVQANPSVPPTPPAQAKPSAPPAPPAQAKPTAPPAPPVQAKPSAPPTNGSATVPPTAKISPKAAEVKPPTNGSASVTKEKASEPRPAPAGKHAAPPRVELPPLKTSARPVEAEPEAEAPGAGRPTSIFSFETSQSAPPVETPSYEPAPAGGSKKMVWVLVAAVALLAIAGGGFFLFRSKPEAPSQTAVQDSSPLALRVERNQGQLMLTWNRSAPMIQGAQRAILSISDGDHKEDVELDLGQLQTGSIVYSPITSDVSFRLEVTDLKNSKSTSESVRVLAGRPSPSAKLPLTATAPVTQQPAAQPATTSGQADAGETAEAPAETAATPTPKAPPKQMAPVPQSLASRLRTGVAELPPELEGTSGSAGRPFIPAAPSRIAAPPPDPAKAQAVKVGGKVKEAKLVYRVSPTYPLMAKQSRISGSVRVEATVGRDGRVQRVQVISGPPLLRQAAIDAVRQWRYSPTLLNGEAVPVVTQVDLSFSLK